MWQISTAAIPPRTQAIRCIIYVPVRINWTTRDALAKVFSQLLLVQYIRYLRYNIQVYHYSSRCARYSMLSGTDKNVAISDAGDTCILIQTVRHKPHSMYRPRSVNVN